MCVCGCINADIALVLQITYKRCPEAILASALHLSVSAATSFGSGWTRTTDGLVVFPARAENTPRSLKAEDRLRYADVADVVRMLA